MQWYLAKLICTLLAASCIAALTIFYLQGFGVAGFKLDASLMHWIGAVTIGTLGGLATIVYRACFDVPQKPPSSTEDDGASRTKKFRTQRVTRKDRVL